MSSGKWQPFCFSPNVLQCNSVPVHGKSCTIFMEIHVWRSWCLISIKRICFEMFPWIFCVYYLTLYPGSVLRTGLTWKLFKKCWYILSALNWRALELSHLNKIHIFQHMGNNFVWNLKGCLWNSTQNISYSYIERYNYYTTLKFLEVLDLRAHTQ